MPLGYKLIKFSLGICLFSHFFSIYFFYSFIFLLNCIFRLIFLIWQWIRKPHELIILPLINAPSSNEMIQCFVIALFFHTSYTSKYDEDSSPREERREKTRFFFFRNQTAKENSFYFLEQFECH